MKSVLISIRPKWCEKIANGEKTIEVRKTKPKLETPFKCYIYCTKPKYDYEDYIVVFDKPDSFFAGGKVIGEFVCDWIMPTAMWRLEGRTGRCAERMDWEEDLPQMACLTLDEIRSYAGSENRIVYAWRISDLKVYDQPKELSEFSAVCKYINDDGTCPTRKVSCSYQQIDYNQDGSINLVECGKKIERPPQSWCYVEEV